MKKLKIISDGTGHGTKVVTSDGQDIGPVMGIEWSLDGCGYAIAKITFAEVQLDAAVMDIFIQGLATDEGRRAIINAIKEVQINNEL